MYCIDCYGLLCLKGDWKEQKLVMSHEETLLMILLNRMIALYWIVISLLKCMIVKLFFNLLRGGVWMWLKYQVILNLSSHHLTSVEPDTPITINGNNNHSTTNTWYYPCFLLLMLTISWAHQLACVPFMLQLYMCIMVRVHAYIVHVYYGTCACIHCTCVCAYILHVYIQYVCMCIHFTCVHTVHMYVHTFYMCTYSTCVGAYILHVYIQYTCMCIHFTCVHTVHV